MNVWMRNLGAVIAVASGLVGAPAAQADPPTITSVPAQDYVDTTCGFPVAVHFTTSGETMKTFSNGTVLVTGPLKADFTANGQTLSLNLSGPTTIRPSGDTVTILAHGVGAGPIDTPTGQTLAYLAGPVLVSPSTGVGVLEHGTVLLDICQALAG